MTETRPMAKITLNDRAAFVTIRDLGLTVRKTDGEYRVAFRGPNNEETAYYTNDLKDAVDTARSMAALKASSENR